MLIRDYLKAAKIKFCESDSDIKIIKKQIGDIKKKEILH